MGRKEKGAASMEVIWRKEEKKLTLTKECVLELSFCWPEVAGRNMKLPHSYYQRVRKGFRVEWERELYLRACMDLVEKRENARKFVPWKAGLEGEVLWQNEQYCSIVMCVREIHGDGRPLEYRWGDVWNKADGCPVLLKECFSDRKRWRRMVYAGLDEGAVKLKEQGIYLEPDGEKDLKKWISHHNFAMTGEEVILYFPQCTVAPAVEGVLEFRIPRTQLT